MASQAGESTIVPIGLQGFHAQNPGIQFREAYRWGLSGPYLQFVKVRMLQCTHTHSKIHRLNPIEALVSNACWRKLCGVCGLFILLASKDSLCWQAFLLYSHWLLPACNWSSANVDILFTFRQVTSKSMLEWAIPSLDAWLMSGKKWESITLAYVELSNADCKS